MDEFNADRLRATLDAFLLKRFSDDGPLSVVEIQQRSKPIVTLLEFFAIRSARQPFGSVVTVLQRLCRDGWLKAEQRLDEDAESALVYSLTAFGERRMAAVSIQLESMLSQFVEHGDMDKSFGRFLDRRR